ncbi:MAG: DUF4942 domain-containing protein [Betaproteobacteria bacterium]|nr:DUF4942 domain-containing protein [Betaproteobacteria bacterium]
MTGSNIVRKDSIEELCGHRARAIQLYKHLIETLQQARAAHARACPGKSTISTIRLDELNYRLTDDRFLDQVREQIDGDMWRAFLVNTPLGSLMDLDERKKFEDSLKKPPEVTPETVFATMDRLRSESGVIFRRGLVNAFSRLSRDYRSHDGFKIGPRVILEYVAKVDVYNGRISYVMLQHYAEERLRDLDRVFHVLDGEEAPDYLQGLCAAMREAMRDGGKTWEVETPYFRVKWFKNGNAHLYFLRDDLVQRANRMIAEHYGLAVGAAPDVADKRRGCEPPPEPALDDFYPTPAELVQEMIEAAELEPGHRVLEPSAGEGAIAAAVAEIAGYGLTCFEAEPGRAKILRHILPIATVHEADFLRSVPEPVYDRILMNPPFTRGADVLHVRQAIASLAPGGRLVAIMSAGVNFRTDSQTTEIRNLITASGGKITPLPPGTFRDAGTNVNTVLVVLSKAA